MKVMNNLVKLPELQNDMQELSMEFMKAGIMDEMVQDAIEMDDDEIEDEADEEVDKVLIELTAGI
jgi:charged multivesicular body protein 3